MKALCLNGRKEGMEKNKPANQENTEVKDSMTDEEFSNLIYCIYKSKFIPRGIKKKIEATLNDIC